ncbi:hypothetical protein ACFXKI_07115 [Streptomyces mirabilis]|uniref:hypothetical protein n=1 Tax=Streptomyces mirabilis TaxID=68239 RepID=UPI00369526FA
MESGRVLDRRYKLESPLGRGAQGSVWLGLDLRLNRPVAVKAATLHRHPGQGGHSEELDRRVERFRKEAQAMARVQNRPHVAVIHDHGEDGDILYSVMEYIEGRPLSAHTGQGRHARLTGSAWGRTARACSAPITTASSRPTGRRRAGTRAPAEAPYLPWYVPSYVLLVSEDYGLGANGVRATR